MYVEEGEHYFLVKNSALFPLNAEATGYAEGWMRNHTDYRPEPGELADEIENSALRLAKARK